MPWGEGRLASGNKIPALRVIKKSFHFRAGKGQKTFYISAGNVFGKHGIILPRRPKKSKKNPRRKPRMKFGQFFECKQSPTLLVLWAMVKKP
jgi:hypothetical protein